VSVCSDGVTDGVGVGGGSKLPGVGWEGGRDWDCCCCCWGWEGRGLSAGAERREERRADIRAAAPEVRKEVREGEGEGRPAAELGGVGREVCWRCPGKPSLSEESPRAPTVLWADGEGTPLCWGCCCLGVCGRASSWARSRASSSS